VILDHGLGIYSLYAHLSRIDVKVGDIISNGEQLGLSGATGRVTGPHLHWGMRVQGARVDPFTLVNLN
jgi:murein DD-endopeptidase MepM/ murein hydrolase activator NlpD